MCKLLDGYALREKLLDLKRGFCEDKLVYNN